MDRRNRALHLLQRIRDEAHRFAVRYNRKLRSKRTLRSDLADIPGSTGRGPEATEIFGSTGAVITDDNQLLSYGDARRELFEIKESSSAQNQILMQWARREASKRSR